LTEARLRLTIPALTAFLLGEQSISEQASRTGGRMARLSSLCISAAMSAVIGVAVPAMAQDASAQIDGRYMVKFRSLDGATAAIAAAGGRVALELTPQNVIAAYLPAQALQGLQHNPNVEYIEVDPRRYPLAQSMPYGIHMVQADNATLNVSGASNGSTVCIIDSGYYAAHEDLQDSNVGGTNDPGTGNWYEDTCGHGSHVAGTISALNNDMGVIGVNSNGLIRLRIEKVFNGSTCGWAYSSSLITALNRCQTDAGSSKQLVVNMSLGGSVSSRTEKNAFQQAYNAGVLPVAAAGNDGNNRTSYPAGYPSVVSVAAVDSSGTVASFSQHNSSVELAAPGVGVLSTTPFKASTLTAGGVTWTGANIDGSARVNASGTLVDGGLCDSVGSWNGKVVLCQRGSISFAQKVANVQSGGGSGAAIYNNVSGGFLGTLNGTSTIPAISLSLEDGQAALGKVSQTSTLANTAGAGSSYEAWDGTSMATPHVSGVAALVWSFYPGKTNADIRAALQQTALDEGAAGRDDYYGYGIVQAKAAFDYLAGSAPPPPPPPSGEYTLTVTKVKAGRDSYADLNWSGATGSTVDYYFDGSKAATIDNSGSYQDGPLARGSHMFQICDTGTSTCSNEVTAKF
jgi:serine protease